MSANGIGNPADVSISGLIAQSARMKVISANIANSSTPEYRRRDVVLSAGADDLSVEVQRIAQDLMTALKRVHDPGHPAADKDTGDVLMPNVELPVEMMHLMSASRAYQANAAALKRYQDMVDVTLELLR